MVKRQLKTADHSDYSGDVEVDGISASYTSGGMTVTALIELVQTMLMVRHTSCKQ